MCLKGNMSPRRISTRIPLQVGRELRIRNNCELRVSNPTSEVMSDDHGQPVNPEDAADAAFDYRFDPETAEHVIRLLKPAKS